MSFYITRRNEKNNEVIKGKEEKSLRFDDLWTFDDPYPKH